MSLLSRLSYRSAGESHGSGIAVLLEGVPRGLPLDLEAIDAELKRRQGGAGRGGRQRIESDHLEVTAGCKGGVTLGSPLGLWVANRDRTLEQLPQPSRPRPGHADLAGCYRYLDDDIRATLERSSARETAGRVAAGGVLKQLLGRIGCEVFGFVRSVGRAELPAEHPGSDLAAGGLAALREVRDQTLLYTLAKEADRQMLAEVREAGSAGDTVGGVVEVAVVGVPPGLGSGLQWCERLDARLGAAILSIPAFKGVEIGLGFEAARRRGSEVHDPIEPGEAGLVRPTNRAGGLEGGMTNGQILVVRGAMKPISTLVRPLPSVDLRTGRADAAGYERSDVCAVSAASVVAEAMVALVVADAALARLGGETVGEFEKRCRAHLARAREVGRPKS